MINYFFSRHLKDPQKTLESMLNTKITLFPGHIQSVYYQNILKVLTFLLQSSPDEDFLHQPLISMTIEKMNSFLSSGDVEAQERVCFSIYLLTNQANILFQASVILHILKTVLKLMEKSEFNIDELSALFDGILNPVAHKAQRKVVVPAG